MNTNLLIAINNVVKDPVVKLLDHYKSNNRANNMGDALEYYVKDLFCGTQNVASMSVKNKSYSMYFSYIGNQNNPPDIMIKNGDAIEVKKNIKLRSNVALNSSYPKDKLYSDSPMITKDCKECESWSVKDMLYVIGTVSGDNLSALWFVDGSCYAADRKIYESIKNQISKGVNELPGVDVVETNELGRVNKVDPLGITLLRIRGMWHIDNPIKVFDYVSSIDDESVFSLRAIISNKKYKKFPKKDRKMIEEISNSRFQIENIEIKSPNNPANLIEAKLISYTI